jgi:alpha-1,2-mannosyltransferase
MPTSSPTGTEAAAGNDRTPAARYSLAARLGVILSAGMLIAITVMVMLDPRKRSVSAGYMDAALRFWAGEPLYNPEASAGFLYLPVFALAYLPLTAFGLTLGDLIWRSATVGLLAFAILRMSRRLAARSEALELFGLALIIGLVGAAGAVRNGQSTTLLVAATLLAFDAAFDRSLAKAAFWATLAVVAKPLGIVVWLLIGGTRPAALPWLLGFLAIALGLPYAVADPAYVTTQYATFVEVLRHISPELGGAASWTDFMAVVRALGLSVAEEIAYAIRAVAAVLTFAAVLALMRRPDYVAAALFPAALACSYMLLFNPRAETNTYILMAVPFALLAAYMLRETTQVAAGRSVVIACVALGTGALGRWVMNTFDPWSKPLLLVLVLTVCAVALLGSRAPKSEP